MTEETLVILDISSNATKSVLLDVFKLYNCNVKSAHIFHHQRTTYGIVTTLSTQHAQKAFDCINFTKIGDDNCCHILWNPSPLNAIVYVDKLHISVDDKTLFDSFSIFGSISSCKVFNNRDNSLRFGFVHYYERQSTVKAVEGFNGMHISNQTVFAELLHWKDVITYHKKRNELDIITHIQLVPIDCLNLLFGKNNKNIKDIEYESKVEEINIDIMDLYGKDINKSLFLLHGYLHTINQHIIKDILNLCFLYYLVDDEPVKVIIKGTELSVQKAICLITMHVDNQIYQRIISGASDFGDKFD
eukprot:278703_1